MKKVIKALIIASLLLLSLCHYAGADTWEEVVDEGFGEPSNDYTWSMATFQGKLYVGTLNSNRGAEIWSSSSGEPDTWQRAYNTLRSSNLGIRTLYADGDQFLYAGTSNISGTEIIRTADGRIWTTVGRRGLGDRRNSSIRCMIRFKDYLYAGTGSKMAKLYRSKDGLQWELVKPQPGFESTQVSYPNTPGVEVTNNILSGRSGCEIWKLVPSDNDQYSSSPDASPVSSENTQLPPSTHQFIPSRNQHPSSIKVADWNKLIQQRLSDAQSKNT